MTDGFEEAVHATERCLLHNRFAGFDPYDALTSPVIKSTVGRARWGRIAATQVLRRLPINVRPLLRIERQINAKTVALFLLGSMARVRRSMAVDWEGLRIAADWAVATGLAGLHGAGWGYYFDWQSRAFFLPAGTPTIVNTAFMTHGLLDYWQQCDEQPHHELTDGLLTQFRSGFRRTRAGRGYCFAYSPIDSTMVHNANLLGASAYLRLALAVGDKDAFEDALGSVEYTVSAQRADGSWVYGQSEIQGWVDSFHTGFNLYALQRISAANATVEAQVSDAYARGMEYFVRTFFGPNGEVSYYDKSPRPYDAHCPATCIGVLSRSGEVQMKLAERVAAWMIHRFRGDDGLFDYRVGRLGYRNSIRYMRWVQAWVFWGFSELLVARRVAGEQASEG